jgi:hypothetical protein
MLNVLRFLNIISIVVLDFSANDYLTASAHLT